jgi:hypothetical protein
MATPLGSDRTTITMSDDITNMFSVAATQQSPLDIQFFTFSAMLRAANAIPKTYVLQDPTSTCDDGFSNRLTELCTISMEDILSPKTYQHEKGDENDYNHSLDLCDSAISCGISNSEETCVAQTSICT